MQRNCYKNILKPDSESDSVFMFHTVVGEESLNVDSCTTRSTVQSFQLLILMLPLLVRNYICSPNLTIDLIV